MKTLSPKLLLLVEQVVKRAQSGNEEQADDLRREMLSHFFEEERELLLQGHSQKEVISMVTQRFGDIEEVGKQLYMVQRRFEHLPLIGSLLYYRPVLMAVKLFFVHLLLFFLIAIVPIDYFFDRFLGKVGVWDFFVQFQNSFPVFILFFAGIGEGVVFAKGSNCKLLIEAFILSYVPILFFVFFSLLDDLFMKRGFFDASTFLVFLCIAFFQGLGLLIGLYFYKKLREKKK
ncbi:MAG: hypothetical protein WCP97_00015 [bacterium]